MNSGPIPDAWNGDDARRVPSWSCPTTLERVMALSNSSSLATDVADPLEDALITRIVRGVVGGELAGAVFALLTMWFATSLGGEAKMPLLMMSTIATGRDAMASGSASVAVGVGVHLILSALFGVLFALLVPHMRTNATLLISGLGWGLVVYVVNFRLISPTVFPVFQDANQPFEVLVHLVYGLIVATLFLSRGIRANEPRFDWK
jgi:hypothetical protein